MNVLMYFCLIEWDHVLRQCNKLIESSWGRGNSKATKYFKKTYLMSK